MPDDFDLSDWGVNSNTSPAATTAIGGAAGAPNSAAKPGFGNSLLSYLQFLGLHPQGASVPNPQPGDTGGYWNASQPQGAQPMGGMSQPTGPGQGPAPQGVDYRMTIPSTGKGPSMMGGGGGGGGSAGGMMGGMTGGQGGGSMMDIAKLAMLFI